MKINSKSEQVWHRIVHRKKIQELVKQYRLLLGIPDKGFVLGTEVRKFYDDILKDKSKLIKLAEFSMLCKKDIKIPQQMEEVLRNFLVENKADLTNVDVSGVDWNFEEFKTKGIISISLEPTATISDLNQFINRKKRHITALQNSYLKSHNLRRGKLKPSKNFDRDLFIYYFNSLSKEQLLRYSGGVPASKDILIKRIFKLKFPEYKITSDIVRAVVARQKRIREKPL